VSALGVKPDRQKRHLLDVGCHRRADRDTRGSECDQAQRFRLFGWASLLAVARMERLGLYREIQLLPCNQDPSLEASSRSFSAANALLSNTRIARERLVGLGLKLRHAQSCNSRSGPSRNEILELIQGLGGLPRLFCTIDLGDAFIFCLTEMSNRRGFVVVCALRLIRTAT
jgi:hypothetical protein